MTRLLRTVAVTAGILLAASALAGAPQSDADRLGALEARVETLEGVIDEVIEDIGKLFDESTRVMAMTGELLNLNRQIAIFDHRTTLALIQSMHVDERGRDRELLDDLLAATEAECAKLSQ